MTPTHTANISQDHVLYESFNGIVLAEEEGKNIAKALGNKKAALLQNHGLLTCGGTVEEAVFWFVSLEKCCHAQLLADAAAGAVEEVRQRLRIRRRGLRIKQLERRQRDGLVLGHSSI